MSWKKLTVSYWYLVLLCLYGNKMIAWPALVLLWYHHVSCIYCRNSEWLQKRLLGHWSALILFSTFVHKPSIIMVVLFDLCHWKMMSNKFKKQTYSRISRQFVSLKGPEIGLVLLKSTLTNCFYGLTSLNLIFTVVWSCFFRCLVSMVMQISRLFMRRIVILGTSWSVPISLYKSYQNVVDFPETLSLPDLIVLALLVLGL